MTIGDNNTHYHYSGDKNIPPALTKPPFRSEIFLGREDDLKTIKEKLFSEGNNMLLLVNGHGGVGKTSVAAQYYTTCQNDYRYTAWVGSEYSIANALLANLTQPLGLVFEPQEKEAERLDKLLHAMAKLDKPCLLVIDNANDLEDLEHNYQRLRQCSNFHILLTSRIREFRRAAFYPIKGLPKDKALELFEEYYQPPLTAEELPLFYGIYEAVEGNTLVVEILAKNLYLFNRKKGDYTLSDLLADLQHKGVLDLPKTVSVEVDYQQYRKENPKDIIAAMYDIQPLSEIERQLLSVFAVLPSETIPLATLEAHLLPDMPELRATAYLLSTRGWLEYYEANKEYKCHPLVQEITRKKNTFLRADCNTLIDALIAKLEYDTLHEGNYKYATLFAHYAETVVKVFEEPVLCQNIGNYHTEIGNLDKALFFYLKCEQLSKQLLGTETNNPNFKRGLAVSYSKLGDTYMALGNLEKALNFFEDENKLFEEFYKSDPNYVDFKNGLAVSYERLGLTYIALGNLDRALNFFEDENKLFEELYKATPIMSLSKRVWRFLTPNSAIRIRPLGI
ncbi:MAG: hypothetical protein IPL35_08745 [Sphingobacteriales bacterium]|nr:hypothetical protein [Sphingobacteriales bacterium]